MIISSTYNFHDNILVAVDDGHGLETAGKRSPNGIKENEFNHYTKVFLIQALHRCRIKTIDVSPERHDTTLKQRVFIANNNNASIFISIHFNALNGVLDDKKGGLSIYHYEGSIEGRKLASCIHNFMIGGTKQRNLGIKTANFFVLRNTNMPAILSENGFMDSWEHKLMRSEKFKLEVAEEHCKGICCYFGKEYIPAKNKTESKVINYPTFEESINLMHKEKIIENPKYWLSGKEKFIDEYTELLIKKFGKYILTKV